MLDVNILKKLIEKTQISQRETANAMSIPAGTFQAYLRKSMTPSVENLVKMADYYAVPVDFLLGRCTKEQEAKILNDYSANFMKLRRASYESYLIGRSKLPQQYISGKYELPYPYNIVADITGKTIDWILTSKNEEAIEWGLSQLPEKNRECVNMYYRDGLNYEEVAKKNGLSKERVRQIVQEGLRKLRNPAISRMIILGWHSIEEFDKYVSKCSDELQREKEKMRVKKEVLSKKEQELEQLQLECEEKYQTINEEFNSLITVLKENGNEKRANELCLRYQHLCKDNKFNDMRLEELGMSTRAYCALKRYGIDTVGEILYYIENNLEAFVHIRNLGRKSYEEVLSVLDSLFGTGNLFQAKFSYDKAKSNKGESECLK